MKRSEIFISKEQFKQLEQRAAETGVPVETVLDEAVEEFIRANS